MRLHSRASALSFSLLLVLSACGGGGDDASPPDDGGDATTAAPAGDAGTTAAPADEATDSTTGGGNDDGGEFNYSQICLDASQAMSAALNAYGTGLAGAMTGSVDAAQLETAAGQLRAMADAAPDEIKDDLGALATELGKVYAAFAEADYQPGQVPTPEQLATLNAVMESVDQDAVETAGENVSAWFDQNCR